jgi:phosphatidylethanolamine-binding protein (PEBP) family uncharacterized protein
VNMVNPASQPKWGQSRADKRLGKVSETFDIDSSKPHKMSLKIRPPASVAESPLSAVTLVTTVRGLAAGHGWVVLGRSSFVSIPTVRPLTLTSPAFSTGSEIPRRHTQCGSGFGVSPPLEWTGGPKAKEYVLTLTDVGNDFVNWIVYRIPGSETNMRRGSLPPRAQERNPYFLPCFPGRSNYVFTLYALDHQVRANWNRAATQQDVMRIIKCCLLEKATLKTYVDS